MTGEHIAVLTAAGVLALLTVVFDRWVFAGVLAVAALVRRTQQPGIHRPDTVVLVDDLHRITYPALYERYRPYVELYGYGTEQAAYWCWRQARMAYLRELAELRRERREMEADYGWLELEYAQPFELTGAQA